jgi:CHASE3 domain sensor protein
MDIIWKIALIALILLLVLVIVLISIYAIRQRRHRKRTVECARNVLDLTKRVMVSMESKAVPNLYV